MRRKERTRIISLAAMLLMTMVSCKTAEKKEQVSEMSNPTAADLLGDPDHLAMSYSGWRSNKRTDELCPTVKEIKEDLRILHAMGVRLIRTYNTQGFPQTERTLQAIAELKSEEKNFEMYVMLGAWIQCEPSDTQVPQHDVGDNETNSREIMRAIEMAQMYPDIIKIIAVGNEAMVTWQPHHVVPSIIHRWVNVLRQARNEGGIPPETWITTSDNWAALGGEASYQNPELLSLLRSLDYISLHTYAFHDTYYHPTFEWSVAEELNMSIVEQRERAVARAIQHQKGQVAAVRAYLDDNGITKEIHIGETGWATRDDGPYGPEGTAAADEFTTRLFYNSIREWTKAEGMSCFYFSAFDEPWKSSTPDGSESHFGLFTVDGRAKAPVWDLVKSGVFKDLGRNGQPVTCTLEGSEEALLQSLYSPRQYKFKP